MHIAIDDTYGPENDTGSKFVTGGRRTHVAVVFPDKDVQDIRTQTVECLAEINSQFGVAATEFHFVDIYNRKPPWNGLPKEANLVLFEFFSNIYGRYRWPVFIQTIDDRTFGDHSERLAGKIEGLELSNRADLSLMWLLLKVKRELKKNPEQITLLLDEGRKKPGTSFGSDIFHDWPDSFEGSYASSAAEPLLQIADFLAFCINRSTYLGTKAKRSNVDAWFLDLVGQMGIACDDLKRHHLPKDFSVDDFDKMHLEDRATKGL